MDQKATAGSDVITIIAEQNALVFATRKEWRELPEICLGELMQTEIMLVFKGTESVFFLLRSMNPFEYLNDTGNAFRLVKVSIDEETGKQIFFIMNLCRAEAAQLMRNKLTLWE